jgi:hypothetical protein
MPRYLEAGVWIFGRGVESQRASVVATDGTVTDGPHPGDQAVACRCAQEVREIMYDPDS